MFTGSKGIKKPFLFSGLILLVVTLAILAWCYWPLPVKQQSLVLTPAHLQALNPGIPLPAFLLGENRQLALSYPLTLRQGETGLVELRWDVSTPSTSAPAAGSGASVLVEARLDLLGILQNPSGSIDAPLFPGQALVLQWQVSGVQAGRFSGTLWSYLNPATDSSSTSQQAVDAFQPVGAQDIELQVISLFGMDLVDLKSIGFSGLVFAFGLIGYAFLPKPKKLRRSRPRPQRNRK